MFLVNLSWLQFAAVFGVLSAGMVALYLWDRSRRRVTVPTLRFWQASAMPSEVKHRKRIQQPWSLLLQLLSVALLLLALAQPRLGAPGPVTRDHVLILDTSAWMGARVGDGTLMERARAAAAAYVRALASGDRVMLVRADALATPATAFEHNRTVVEQAVAASHPGSTALNLEQAVQFARQAQKLQGGSLGDIAYAGPGHTTAGPETQAAGIRVLPVGDATANIGLRRMGARRSATDPDVWEILASVHNYGTAPRNATLALTFSGAPVGSRRLILAAGAGQDVEFEYRTRNAGVLEARLQGADSFPADNRAALELPAQEQVNVLVYSDQPELLRPVLAASRQVNAVFRRTSEYRPGAAADVLLFDRFSPPELPAAATIWIEPPAGGGPVAEGQRVSRVGLSTWRADHPLAAGLRAKDLRLDSAEVLVPGPDDVAVAEADAGPVIVAHSQAPKFVVLGFHPVRGALKYELTTPLLFANILRWMAPEVFRHRELNAGSPGTIAVDVGRDAAAGAVRVAASDGTQLPYSVEDGTLRFFAGTPGTVRVTAGDREMLYSFTLPELAESRWIPPAGAHVGVPRHVEEHGAFVELWPWLALAGMLGLAIEWLLFGRGLPATRQRRVVETAPRRRAAVRRAS